MNKIASPHELQASLRSILAYVEGDTPSRARVAGELLELATKVAAEPRAYAAVTRPLEILMGAEFGNPAAMRHLNDAFRSIEQAARVTKLG